MLILSEKKNWCSTRMLHQLSFSCEKICYLLPGKLRKLIQLVIFFVRLNYEIPTTVFQTGSLVHSQNSRMLISFFRSEANDVNLFLMIFPQTSLSCKLVPVHYREYDYGLKRNLEMLVFQEEEKLEYPENNPSEQSQNQQQTQPTYDSGPGHIGMRQALSSVHLPCLLFHDL